MRCMWKSSAALAITPEDRKELNRIVLGAADGVSNNALAKDLKTSRPTVIEWRNRYQEGGIKALYEDRPRGKSYQPLTRAKEAEVIAKTQTTPQNMTHWSCRKMAKICGISKASIQRVWHANGLKPHLVKGFKLSRDPRFVEKLEDVVGLYLSPMPVRKGRGGFRSRFEAVHHAKPRTIFSTLCSTGSRTSPSIRTFVPSRSSISINFGPPREDGGDDLAV